MPDWTKSMQQTYEFYEVDTKTWSNKRPLDFIKSADIVKDSSNDTLEYATIETTEEFDECYVRIYLVTIQNEIEDKIPLGTYLCQAPGFNYDGKTSNITVDAYSSISELKDGMPNVGYYIAKTRNIAEISAMLTEDNVRAPVVAANSSSTLKTNFVANPDDTWFSFLKDLLAQGDLSFELDAMGNVLFSSPANMNTMRPIWTYTDGNSSILYPDIDLERDLYGIPNVVQVVYSDDNGTVSGQAVNNDADSPTSTKSRGRKIIYREVNPDSAPANVSSAWLNEYAELKLKELSTLEYKVTYTHGYCPVRVGDCVSLDYSRAGIKIDRALVTRQHIKCIPGCPVEETAIYTINLWGDN